MARGYVATLINGLPTEIRSTMQQIVDYVQDNWRLGEGTRATNAQLYKFDATTAAIANGEFSIAHNMGQVPSKIVPVLDLTQIGSQLVPLTVSRAPDVKRIYLSSPTASAAIQIYAEF